MHKRRMLKKRRKRGLMPSKNRKSLLFRVYAFILGFLGIFVVAAGLLYWNMSVENVASPIDNIIVIEKQPVATSTPAVIVREEQPEIPPAPVVEKQPEVIKAVIAPPAPRLNYSFGMSMGETLSVVSGDELERQLDDLVSLGVGWIRVDLSWNTIQPHDKDTYQWGAFDRIVRAARARDMRVLPIITYTPAWARLSDCAHSSKCEPADPVAFAEFAYSAVKRYSPQGVYAWEVWNEPNIQKFWARGASPARYTALLKMAHTAIHEADSGALVISGGLAPASTGGGNISPREFLERMYENGAKEYFDAVGFHPYSFPLGPTDRKSSNAWFQMTAAEWSIRGIMIENNDGNKNVWLTEYGAPTGGPGSAAADSDQSIWATPSHVTEGYQNTMLQSAVYGQREYGWAGPLFWYSYRDLGTSRDTIENFFGLIRADGTAKPAYFTLKTLLTN